MSGTNKHRARKRFGQNFLHDPAIIQRIARAISPAGTDHIVEIGPGKGAITQELLPHCARLDVIELDRDLLPLLQASCKGIEGNLNVHSADALKFDFCGLSRGATLRVVGNLPYNISTPLLFHLMAQITCIEDMHFMLQKEVVDRMAASPGSKDWGRLSVMCQYFCEVVPLFRIRPGAFQPAPRVESAFVRLLPHRDNRYADCKKEALEQLVTRAFSQRRKTLRNNLKGLIDEEQIRSLGIDPGCRPETLNVEQFCQLSSFLLSE